jgi:hypothetical protein
MKNENNRDCAPKSKLLCIHDTPFMILDPSHSQKKGFVHSRISYPKEPPREKAWESVGRSSPIETEEVDRHKGIVRKSIDDLYPPIDDEQ